LLAAVFEMVIVEMVLVEMVDAAMVVELKIAVVYVATCWPPNSNLWTSKWSTSAQTKMLTTEFTRISVLP
jgi:hypothetical protein